MSFWTLSVPDPAAPALRWWAGPDELGFVTYGRLADACDRFLDTLAGPPRKQLGVVLCRNTFEAVVGYLSALRGGHAVMLLPDGLEPVLLTTILEAYRPDWIYRPVGGFLLDGYGTGDVRGQWALHRREATEDGPAIHPDLALLLSTSGTTGNPKMVRLSFDNLAANAHSIVSYLGITSLERAMATLPLNYSFGMSVVNSHLLAGGSMVLTEASLLNRPFWDAFAAHGATSLAGVPYSYQILHRLGVSDMSLPTLQTLTQAGGALNPKLVEYFCRLSEQRGWRFFVMYGQTEAAPRISYVPPSMLAAKVGSIGIAVPGGRLSLSPDGELIYEGANVMMGYALGRSDLEKSDEMGGRLETGDLARVDSDGYFYLEGRIKRLVKIHGNRVNLDDVEQRLEERLQQPVAVVGSDDLLKIFLAERAAAEMVPALMTELFHLHASTYRVQHIDSVPFAPSGKKDYAGLPQ